VAAATVGGRSWRPWQPVTTRTTITATTPTITMITASGGDGWVLIPIGVGLVIGLVLAIVFGTGSGLDAFPDRLALPPMATSSLGAQPKSSSAASAHGQWRQPTLQQ
jgi:hypothetical protein